jgi:hypothetical protein
MTKIKTQFDKEGFLRVTTKTVHGYIFVKVGELWIAQHRLVAEEVLGRQLTYEEKIHHIDFNRKNNEPSNLCLFENQKAHIRFHLKLMQFGETNPIKRELEVRSILNQAKLEKT